MGYQVHHIGHVGERAVLTAGIASSDAVRVSNLNSLLRRKTLGVCSGGSLPFGDPPHRESSQLFVPEDNLRFIFHQYIWERWADDYGFSRAHFPMRHLQEVCEEHIDETSRRLKAMDLNAVCSLVERQGDKLIAIDVQQDVTRAPILRRYDRRHFESLGLEPAVTRGLYATRFASLASIYPVLDPTKIS